MLEMQLNIKTRGTRIRFWENISITKVSLKVCWDLAELFNFQFKFKCKSGTIRREQRSEKYFYERNDNRIWIRIRVLWRGAISTLSGSREDTKSKSKIFQIKLYNNRSFYVRTINWPVSTNFYFFTVQS